LHAGLPSSSGTFPVGMLRDISSIDLGVELAENLEIEQVDEEFRK
jgi:hypothetical protein